MFGEIGRVTRGDKMKLYKYRIYYMNEPIFTTYLVHAKDAIDARVMGEVWGKRWDNKVIERIDCEGEVNER